MLPFREGLPLADEVDRLLPGAELAVPEAVLAELDRLAARGAPHAAAARALAGRLRPVASEGRGDDAVVRAAFALRASVVTGDRRLAGVLRGVGVAVLMPRDRVRLDLKLPRAAGPPLARPSVKKRARSRTL